MKDLSFVPTGEAETWTDEGMKVYSYMRYFKDRDTFIETYIREDGFECSTTWPRGSWTDEIKALAKEKGYLSS